jgi:hypothetical protein
VAFSNGNKKSGPSLKSASKKTSKRSLITQENVFRALTAMRHGASISRAARDNGVTPRTIKRYAGSALVQDRPGGRIRAAKSDRLVRYLQIPGPDGPVEITVRGSKTASEVAKYKAAVNRFLRGDRNALKPWEGRKIAGNELLISPAAIKALAERDLVPYSLYRTLGAA